MRRSPRSACTEVSGTWCPFRTDSSLIGPQNRHLARGLHRIRVKPDLLPAGAQLADSAPDLFHRLERPDLVVRRHHGNEHRLGPDRGPDRLDLDDAVLADADVRDIASLFFEIFADIADGRVFDRRRNDVKL